MSQTKFSICPTDLQKIKLIRRESVTVPNPSKIELIVFKKATPNKIYKVEENATADLELKFSNMGVII